MYVTTKNPKALSEVISKNPVYYNRKRSRRLRKKLRVGEFIELGVVVKALFHPMDDDLFDDLYDEVIDKFIEHEMSRSEPRMALGFATAGRKVDSSEYTISIYIEYDHEKTDVLEIIDLSTYYLGESKMITKIDHIDLWNCF